MMMDMMDFFEIPCLRLGNSSRSTSMLAAPRIQRITPQEHKIVKGHSMMRKYLPTMSGIKGLMPALMLLLMLVDTLLMPVTAVKLLPVHWNSQNPMFRVDNTDHVRDVAIGDSVDIVCPQYPPSTPLHQIEQHVIYQVTREEYEQCAVSHRDPRITRQVLMCNKPFDSQTLTIVFREFTPMPNGLEYHRGHDYYYVSTSNGTTTGLFNKEGGACQRHNMKMIFKVCCGDQPSEPPYRPTEQRRYPLVEAVEVEVDREGRRLEIELSNTIPRAPPPTAPRYRLRGPSYRGAPPPARAPAYRGGGASAYPMDDPAAASNRFDSNRIHLQRDTAGSPALTNEILPRVEMYYSSARQPSCAGPIAFLSILLTWFLSLIRQP